MEDWVFWLIIGICCLLITLLIVGIVIFIIYKMKRRKSVEQQYEAFGPKLEKAIMKTGEKEAYAKQKLFEYPTKFSEAKKKLDVKQQRQFKSFKEKQASDAFKLGQKLEKQRQGYFDTKQASSERLRNLMTIQNKYQ